MRSSRRGTGYAVIGFILISGVVAGGMTWATVLTWRLAKLDVEDERAGRRREALLRMDTYLGQIVASEAAREYDDYVAIRTPDAIWSKELEDLIPGDYLQPSPIALYGPRLDRVVFPGGPAWSVVLAPSSRGGCSLGDRRVCLGHSFHSSGATNVGWAN